ncbi:MAG TPA: DUF3089 domain-containing protein [Candidatus Binatia bacterium]|nr:DUF3089 domain-containing protein [Candidatus Binatia bacterium]
MHPHRLAPLMFAVLLVAPPPARAATPPPNPYPGYASATYADPAHWLCRPDTDDVCDHDLDATAVGPNGGTRVERFKPARHPRIDCFYVYPTISTDPGGNSDLVPGADQELFVVRQQAARLGLECRVFAPVYRQVTLTALVAALGGHPIPVDPNLAYADVLDAWKHYIANDNQGRGVILLGHSQGSSVLVRLVKNEIDPNPVLRERLVSAILPGTSLQVPANGEVGCDFQHIPLCHSRRQVGCAISWASFRADRPPPSNTLFGRSTQAGCKAACTNPAALDGGSGTLHPYFPTDGVSLPILTVPPPAWVDPAKRVTIRTPFVTLPHFVDAACADNGFSYLALTVHGDPADARLDDIGGDLTPEWGLHLIDVNVTMGDLVRLARSQAKAFLVRRRRTS